MRFVKCVSQMNILMGRSFRPSTINVRNAVCSMTQTRGVATSVDERQELINIWPGIVKDLVSNEELSDIPETTEWIAKSLNYNVPRGKKVRYFTALHVYKKLVPPEQLTEENLRLARILSLTLEFLMSHIVIIDDVIDGSQNRRGQPCWHRINHVGIAVNDGCIIEHFAYRLLRDNFKDTPYYSDLVDRLHDFEYFTLIGQLADSVLSNFGKKADLNTYTMDRFFASLKYKTSYCTLVFPVLLSMNYVGINDRKIHDQTRDMLLKISRFYQLENDYNDCFDEKAAGKPGTDIQQGQCTWFIVKALELATPEQRKIIEECYGVDDPEKVAKIKQLYADMDMQKMYLNFKAESYNHLKTEIAQMPHDIPHEIFYEALDVMYHKKGHVNNYN